MGSVADDGQFVAYTWGDLWGLIRGEFAQLGGKFWAMTAWDLFVGLIAVAVLILCVYTACMIGHQFKKHTGVASIVAFFLLQSVQGRLGATAGFGSLIRITVNSANVWSAAPNVSETYRWMNLVLMLLFGAAYFAAASWLMKRKLDLE